MKASSAMVSKAVEEGRLGQIDLNLLFTLYEVGRLGTVTAAARSLGRTQPAISTRLKQLEEQLDSRLFERAGPVLRWTPVGRAVLDEVRVLVAQLGTVIDQTRGMGTEPVGTIRIGALPTLCAYMLASIAVRMTRSHPRVRVRMSPGLTAPQLESLRSGELDVLVSVGLVRDPTLRSRTLGEIDACLVVPAGMRGLPSPRRKPLSIEQIRKLELVSYGKIGDPFFDAVWAFLEHADLLRNVRMEVPNIQAIKQLVVEGAGISILPRYTIVESTLAMRELRGLDVRLPLCVVTRPRGDRSPIVREFLRELTEKMGKD